MTLYMYAYRQRNNTILSEHEHHFARAARAGHYIHAIFLRFSREDEAKDNNMEHNNPAMKLKWRMSSVQPVHTYRLFNGYSPKKTCLVLHIFCVPLRRSVPLFLRIDMVDKMAKISTQ